MPPGPLAPLRQGASLGVLGSGGKVLWCARQLVNLDRHGLKKSTTSSFVSVLRNGVTSEPSVLCNYSSRLQMFPRVGECRHSALFFDLDMFAEVRDAGVLSEEPAAQGRGLANVCLRFTKAMDSVSFHQHHKSTRPTSFQGAAFLSGVHLPPTHLTQRK